MLLLIASAARYSHILLCLHQSHGIHPFMVLQLEYQIEHTTATVTTTATTTTVVAESSRVELESNRRGNSADITAAVAGGGIVCLGVGSKQCIFQCDDADSSLSGVLRQGLDVHSGAGHT